jgi:hypothetical protein
VPDVVVIAPATPHDHKGLLAAAIRDPRPVIFCESRHIYGQKGPVEEGEVVEEIGKANVCRLGDDVTVVAWAACSGARSRPRGAGGRPFPSRSRRPARRPADVQRSPTLDRTGSA